MKQFAILVILLAAGACGASFVGPATSNPTDRCHGHLDCGAAGCCEGSDDDGWECNPPGARTVCSYVGLHIDPQTPGDRKKPADPAPPALAPEPDDPNLGEPPPGHGGQG
jgi:hypothetical protein